MKIDKIEQDKIFIRIPLTTQSGKIRVKEHNSFYEYGPPTATRQIAFTQKHYIEWQIGYDVDISNKEKLALSSLQESHFISANGKTKALYKLSEYLFYFVQNGIINAQEIKDLLVFLENINAKDFIDSTFRIERTHPVERKLLGIDFYESQVKYPLLLHKFGNFDILVEIVIKEKQRAIGVQPMLYICFPITQLRALDNKILLNRVAESKEFAYLILDSKHKNFILECFKIFGVLSPNHNHDTREILKVITSQRSNNG
ncbi:R.Pab1 family restriction endonuclease [uncultured Helicobacter sp.]|uniref:R.Pab1 family restriction endonuclease n=1 Tax=uncultured Helicobacter sp. TaxID=175537 RepID=UPI00258E479F|nr:R.Pab1 family restriction endonuclease [uncultured Helicobacter sp.]